MTSDIRGQEAGIRIFLGGINEQLPSDQPFTRTAYDRRFMLSKISWR